MTSRSYLCLLPLRTATNAPRFNESDITHLPRFFEEIDSLTTNIGLTDAQKIKVAIRYANIDEAEFWSTLEASAGSLGWLGFVDSVMSFYPGCEDERKFCPLQPGNLSSLVIFTDQVTSPLPIPSPKLPQPLDDKPTTTATQLPSSSSPSAKCSAQPEIVVPISGTAPEVSFDVAAANLPFWAFNGPDISEWPGMRETFSAFVADSTMPQTDSFETEAMDIQDDAATSLIVASPHIPDQSKEREISAVALFLIDPNVCITVVSLFHPAWESFKSHPTSLPAPGNACNNIFPPLTVTCDVYPLEIPNDPDPSARISDLSVSYRIPDDPFFDTDSVLLRSHPFQTFSVSENLPPLLSADPISGTSSPFPSLPMSLMPSTILFMLPTLHFISPALLPSSGFYISAYRIPITTVCTPLIIPTAVTCASRTVAALALSDDSTCRISTLSPTTPIAAVSLLPILSLSSSQPCPYSVIVHADLNISPTAVSDERKIYTPMALSDSTTSSSPSTSSPPSKRHILLPNANQSDAAVSRSESSYWIPTVAVYAVLVVPPTATNVLEKVNVLNSPIPISLFHIPADSIVFPTAMSSACKVSTTAPTTNFNVACVIFILKSPRQRFTLPQFSLFNVRPAALWPLLTLDAHIVPYRVSRDKSQLNVPDSLVLTNHLSRSAMTLAHPIPPQNVSAMDVLNDSNPWGYRLRIPSLTLFPLLPLSSQPPPPPLAMSLPPSGSQESFSEQQVYLSPVTHPTATSMSNSEVSYCISAAVVRVLSIPPMATDVIDQPNVRENSVASPTTSLNNANHSDVTIILIPKVSYISKTDHSLATLSNA